MTSRGYGESFMQISETFEKGWSSPYKFNEIIFVFNKSNFITLHVTAYIKHGIFYQYLVG